MNILHYGQYAAERAAANAGRAGTRTRREAVTAGGEGEREAYPSVAIVTGRIRFVGGATLDAAGAGVASAGSGFEEAMIGAGSSTGTTAADTTGGWVAGAVFSAVTDTGHGIGAVVAAGDGGFAVTTVVVVGFAFAAARCSERDARD
jgi:hypothetical protein